MDAIAHCGGILNRNSLQFAIFRLRRKIIADFPQRAIHKTVGIHWKKTNIMVNFMIIGFIILTICLWFWAIIDIKKSRIKNPTIKIVWLFIILFFPVVGSIFYFQVRKNLIV